MLLKISALLAKIREKLDEKGQGMVEYALILAAVAIIAIAAIWGGGSADESITTDGNSLRSAVTRAFSTAASKVDNAQGAANTGGGGTGTGTGGGGT